MLATGNVIFKVTLQMPSAKARQTTVIPKKMAEKLEGKDHHCLDFVSKGKGKASVWYYLSFNQNTNSELNIRKVGHNFMDFWTVYHVRFVAELQSLILKRELGSEYCLDCLKDLSNSLDVLYDKIASVQ